MPARYRVFGYNDLCQEFDLEGDSLVKMARIFLQLCREGMCVVFFVDELNPRSKAAKRLGELKYS